MEKTHSQKLLNVGCGDRFHPDWVNIDFVSHSPSVIPHNLLKGIPYPDNTFEVVYHSHVLEHFTKKDAEKFIRECYRVLKPGGIIRIAVPDLEVIARNYLKFLELSLEGSTHASANYDWTMLELYDQTVRTKGGGGMKEYYRQENMPNKDFVKERMGHFFDIMTQKKTKEDTKNWKAAVKKILPIDALRNILRTIKNHIPGEEHRILGKFRMGGEIHQWMYDRFSLGRLLKQAGFREVTQKEATTSFIPHWQSFNLDSEENGATYKPDSLFIEAKK